MAEAQSSLSQSGSGLASSRQDLAAKNLMSLSALVLVLGAAMFSVLLIKLAVPGLFDSTAFIAYGRLRPATMSILVLGFGGTLTQSIAYYLVPRLVGAPLSRERLATLNGYVYAGLISVGVIAVLFTGVDGGAFAEFPIWIDIPLAISMLVPALIVTETVRSRTEAGVFPSLLFAMAGVWWYPALYITANVDAGGGVGTLLQTSVAVGGFLTMALPAAVMGGALYVVAKETDRPLFSGPLARAAFWTLAGTAIAAAPARYMSGPAPAWLESIASVMSLGLAIASITLLANLLLTVSGSWEDIAANPALKLTIGGAGVLATLMTLAGLQGYRAVAAVVGLTTWDDGIAAGIVLVAVPLMGMGFMFHAFPRAAGRSLFEPETANRGMRLTIWSGGATALLFILAGIISGLSWNAGAASGAFTNTGEGFHQTLGSVSAMYTVAAILSLGALTGLALLTWTYVRTFTSGSVRASEVLMVEESGDE